MLIFILQKGHTEILELLLKTPGIDVNVGDNYGQTPLYWAAMVSYIHIKQVKHISIQYINCFTGWTH